LRIIIVEDHPVMRSGLTAYFGDTGRWRVAGAAASINEAKKLLTGTETDVLLLDIQLADGWGLDIIQWFLKHVEQSPGSYRPLMAIYSNYTDYAHVSAAMGMGVKAYICKQRNEKELESALLKALDGEVYIDDKAQLNLKFVKDLFSLLTKRETEILCLVKSGLSNKQIASRLKISNRTVENILSCVYDKTGIKNRLELQNL